MNRITIERAVLFVLVAIFASITVVYLWTFTSTYYSSVDYNKASIESYIEKKVNYNIKVLNEKEEEDNVYVLFSDENESNANILVFKKWHFGRLVYKGGAYRIEKDQNINSGLFGMYPIKMDDEKEKVLVFGINKDVEAKYIELVINNKKVRENINNIYFIISYATDQKEKITVNDIKFYGKHDEDITEKFISSDKNSK